jgi:hypothetical protein
MNAVKEWFFALYERNHHHEAKCNRGAMGSPEIGSPINNLKVFHSDYSRRFTNKSDLFSD